MVAQQTGLALFHNHLIVDAVAAVFPFGSDNFVQLRERFWLETIGAAAYAGRSLIFTFAPEPTVAADFPARLSRVVESAKGEVLHVALDIDETDQEKRLIASDRAMFGKLRSVELLRELRPGITACMAAMPHAALRIDTGKTTATDAAEAIIRLTEASTNAR
jgi:hypothetical protein